MSHENLFAGYVMSRIKSNKNFMAAITGPTGSGKTYSALRLAEQIDSEFNADRIVFTPEEFIKLLNSGTLKRGSVIVADEFGVSMNSRNWQSTSNKLLNYIMQTFRSKNYIVLFTSPDFGFFDAAARKLFHAHLMTVGINKEKKACYLKPYLLQINQRNGQVYYKFPLIKQPGKRTERKFSQLQVQLPSKPLIKTYEVKKDDFVTALNNKIEEQMFQEKETKKTKDQIEVEKKAENIERLRQRGEKWKFIADVFGFKDADVARIWYSRNRTNEA